MDDIIDSSETTKPDLWKHLFEIYKIEVNKSILNSDFVYQTFTKLLKNVENDTKKGCYILGEIYLELRVMAKNKRLDDINTAEIDSCLRQLSELFRSSYGQAFKSKINSRAERCNKELDNRMNAVIKKRKNVEKVVLSSLMTAGLSLAGFATAIGASLRKMTYTDMKSELLLVVSSSGLFLSSASQLAEYLEYNKSFNGIIHDLSQLKENLTYLLMSVNEFIIELEGLIQEIYCYFLETKNSVLLFDSDSSNYTSFLSRIAEIADKTKNLQVNLVKMEVYTQMEVDSVRSGRTKLPRLKRLIKKTSAE